ncbi:HIT family protein [Pelistega europaea]|uniref:HIT family protein n=1 Tax=Pelistega europaea TaxID=106147 RepID=A0A7Y4LBJ6_9BURK|nr:HIT family protein [Pelistega europaea]NOL49301.1 HIT family protein [Pelistega europaea]
MTSCPLCNTPGGQVLYENNFIRVINANDPHYPAFTRVVLQRHIAEMTDLDIQERQRLMDYVYLVEKTQRDILHPDKINLAAFGTMVPHLHWHIIPRFKWDLHFPASVWSAKQRDENDAEYQQQLNKQKMLLAEYEQRLIQQLTQF